MEKSGWPKPRTWLRPIEDAEYAELTAEEGIFEEAGFDMSPLSEDERAPLEESRQDFLELVTSGSFLLAALRRLGCIHRI